MQNRHLRLTLKSALSASSNLSCWYPAKCTHRQLRPLAGSSKAKLFRIEFSDLHVSKEDSIKPWCNQLERQLFEAENLADEDSVFVPADVAAIVHPSQKEILWGT
jgi:hypothetical protein